MLFNMSQSVKFGWECSRCRLDLGLYQKSVALLWILIQWELLKIRTRETCSCHLLDHTIGRHKHKELHLASIPKLSSLGRVQYKNQMIAMSTLSLAFNGELSTLTWRGILSKDMVANGMGWTNVSALYSLFGTIFCILDNQFMIKLPLISAYFEAEFSIRQPKPNQILGLYIKQNH